MRARDPILGASRSELAALFADGEPVAPADLVGYAFRGVSLGLPGFVDRLLWKTFAKVFVDAGDAVHGFNLRIVQGDIDGPYRPRRRKPRFGEFLAVSEGPVTLLDYSPTNPRWHPLATMRDRLVCLDADTFLGRADVSLVSREIKTPSFFTLRRSRQVSPGVNQRDAHLDLDEI